MEFNKFMFILSISDSKKENPEKQLVIDIIKLQNTLWNQLLQQKFKITPQNKKFVKNYKISTLFGVINKNYKT